MSLGTQRVHWTGKPSVLELAEGAAHIAYLDDPSPDTDRAWFQAWMALTGGWPSITTTFCACCGLHRTAMTRESPCRNCGAVNQSSIDR